jgi:hypothetical protein
MKQCPICKSDAEDLRPSLVENALKCTTHGEVEFSNGVRDKRWNEPRAAWERALKKARERAIKTGKNITISNHGPEILDSDFA